MTAPSIEKIDLYKIGYMLRCHGAYIHPRTFHLFTPPGHSDTYGHTLCYSSDKNKNIF